MKCFLGFLMGCVVGVAMAGAVFYARQLELDAQAESYKQTADSRIREEYVSSIIDVAQLGLMLKAVEPELIPVWLEEGLVTQAKQLLEERFRDSKLTGHALRMIVGFYNKNGLNPPAELRDICLNHSALAPNANSKSAIDDTFDDRLATFNAFIAAKRSRTMRASFHTPAATTGAKPRPVYFDSGVAY
jgi:hypothetical protein